LRGAVGCSASLDEPRNDMTGVKEENERELADDHRNGGRNERCRAQPK